MHELITWHLDLWTSAVQIKSTAGRGNDGKIDAYGIKKLRELILELAIRGQLTSQSPDDEPASELLKKVHALKTRMVKAKEIKKPKELPPISEFEYPFKLPAGWSFVRMNDLGEWGAGATPSRGRSDYYGGNIPWFKSGELVADKIEDSEEHVTELALTETSLRYNNAGDVLIAMYGATIGKTAILNKRATTNQAVCACTPFDGIHNVFLLTLLKAYKTRFIDMGAGGAQPNISKEKIVATVVAIPPKAEQFRIVAKVNEMMALCDQLEQQQTTNLEAHQTLVATLLDTLTRVESAQEFQQAWQRNAIHFDTLFTTEHSVDQLKQTILQLAVMGKLVPQDPNETPPDNIFHSVSDRSLARHRDTSNESLPARPLTDQLTNSNKFPNTWRVVTLEDLVCEMDSGWSPACLPDPSADTQTWGVLKTTAVQPMLYQENENKTLPSSKAARPQFEVKAGDILITRAGPKNRVGVSCLVEATRPRLMISDKIIRFHLLDECVYDRYVALCLNAGITAQYLESSKSGMAESQMNISQEKLRLAPIPLCPTREQYRIVAKVDELVAICEALNAQIVNAQTTQLHLTDAIVEQAVA